MTKNTTTDHFAPGLGPGRVAAATHLIPLGAGGRVVSLPPTCRQSGRSLTHSPRLDLVDCARCRAIVERNSQRLPLPQCTSVQAAYDRAYRAAYGRTVLGVERIAGDWFAIYAK